MRDKRDKNTGLHSRRAPHVAPMTLRRIKAVATCSKSSVPLAPIPV
jgi:hypothetical protein